MKKRFSLRTKNLIGNVICGAFWFIAGVFEHWDNTMSKIIVVVANILSFRDSIQAFRSMNMPSFRIGSSFGSISQSGKNSNRICVLTDASGAV